MSRQGQVNQERPVSSPAVSGKGTSKGKRATASANAGTSVKQFVEWAIAKGTAMAIVPEGEGQTVDKLQFNSAAPFIIQCKGEAVDAFKKEVVSKPLAEVVAMIVKRQMPRSGTSYPSDSPAGCHGTPLFDKFLPDDECVPRQIIHSENQLRSSFLFSAYYIAAG